MTLAELELRGEEEGRHPPIELEADEPELEPFAVAREPWPIARVCSRELRAVHDSGPRRLSAIRFLVIHCTQGSTARGAAQWFANPDSRGSAHVVVDGLECYRTLSPSRIPWGAGGVNGSGWHLEIAGFAEWSRTEWLVRDRLLRRAAYKLAVHSRAFGVELRLLSRAQLRANLRGVITHKTASDVFGGSHWDPGSGFPLERVLSLARTYKGRL